MKVTIKNGREVVLNAGDYILVKRHDNNWHLVLGVRSCGDWLSFKEDGSPHRLGNYPNNRSDYNISSRYDDDTGFYTVSTIDIDDIKSDVKNNPCSEQARAAAWGKDEHIPPPGAAFEFL